MDYLFNPGKIGTLTIKNRMIRTASHEGLAEKNGAPTDEQFQFYKGFIDGGIGLIITGYAGICQQGKSVLRHMNMINKDDLILAHKKLTNQVHKIGGKIVLQIAHCGRQTWSKDTGVPPTVAPSAIACGFYKEKPKELTEEEIQTIIKQFAEAAKRAQKAGYDGVQVHGAHGYLLSTFLSGYSNRRKDKWGGSRENKFRIVGEILKAVKKAVGKDYPVLLKINSYEKARKGIRPLECVEFAKMTEDTGCCDGIEVSAGTNECGFVMTRGGVPGKIITKYMRPFSEMNPIAKLFINYLIAPMTQLMEPKFKEGYNLETSALIKKKVSIPVITVGGMRSKNFMEAAIREGKTDFVSMARPLILEPDLANKFKKGQSNIANCNNCNACSLAVDSVRINCYNKKLNPNII